MSVVFTLQTGTDLYLAGDSATANAGFLFVTDPGTLPGTFTLSSTSFTDPNQQGYFAFFAPGVQTDWPAFASQLRSQFQSAAANFGWIAGTGASATIVASLTASLNGNQQQMSASTNFVFPPAGKTATLVLQATFPNFPNIDYDDGSNAFQIPNSPGSGNAVAQLTLTSPVNNRQFTYQSTSDNVIIPMSGSLNGTVQCAFVMGLVDLAICEAGVSYFGPPPAQGGLLTAASFPVVRPAGTAQTLNLAASLDVVQQLDPARCFFQLTDSQLGSYFATATGQTLGFQPVAADPGGSTRFVFANRPVKSTSEQIEWYYLALAGSFTLSLPPPKTNGALAQFATPTAQPVSNALLCGTTGTEFFTVTTGDTLTFVPNQPAYDNSANAVTSGWLTDDVVTSWVQWGTGKGAYVAQPQPSPLYQPGTSAALATDADKPAFLLDFLQLPSWTTPPSMSADVQVSAPLVPLVPFAGVGALDPTTPTAPYTGIEAAAIYPQRRSNFLTEAARLAALPRLTANAATAATAATVYTGQTMTPQGLISQVDNGVWSTLQLAQSPPWTDNAGAAHSGLLQMTFLGSDLIASLQQNQIFLVMSTTGGDKLFSFTDTSTSTIYDEVNIADWIFSLSPGGQAGPALGKTAPPILQGVSVPPILILKFHKGASISDLYSSLGAWTQPTTFNDPNGFTADQAQAYIGMQIDAARAAVAKDGADSIYSNFIAVVDDPNFNGMLALNCNLQLNDLPGAIKGVLGGMKDPTIEAFRAHHVGVAINDTQPQSPDLVMTQSALFGLVDYESAGVVPSILPLDFQVEFMRALFMNAELRQFACKTDLTVNNLFNVDVNLGSSSSGLRALALTAGDSGPKNVISVTGSYQAHSTSGDKTTAGVGVYSFVADGEFEFDFAGTALENPYLQTITLTKLQFSFDQEQAAQAPYTSTITSSFAVWGSMVFKELDVLDIFSFEKLSFSDVKIGVTFDLVLAPGAQPTTSGLGLTFSPGDLRVDFGPGQTKERSSASSMLALLPFKLKSFLYSENADQTLESLGFSPVALPSGMPQVLDKFNYALIFDLDLGSVGALVGSLAAFKFSVIVGWQVATTLTTPPITQSGIAFGIKLPEADGKLEIKIEGVIDLLIETFVLKYVEPTDGTPRMLVVGLHNASLTILGQRIPPSGEFEFALFAPEADSGNPKGGSAKIGWMAAYDNTAAEPKALTGGNGSNGNGNGNGGSKTFDLKFLGGGQRVGPGPSESFTDFASFLAWMKGDFWTAFEAGDYAKVYHPDENWLVLADIVLLETVEIGFVFYDSTPFYALSLNVAKLFDFEITYTKVSDSIGMFYMNFSLPPELRTYQVGLASLTLPSIAVTVYTNGNFKVDLGFPAGTDWSRCFQVQAQAGPVPVTGAGGFYVASLSSATSPKTFQGQYDSILAFGFAAQLGVGKSFTMGPLSAGVSVTFFGIIEGAAGYKSASADEIFKMPDALMLTGNFGIIGQLYGKLDFKIITASVNIVLSASIGIVLVYEPLYGNDGSILLYIEASVEVSVEVKINLGLFSIRITFSFSASIRFDWQLTGPAQSNAPQLSGAFEMSAALTVLTPIPLITGLQQNVPLWFLPEFTVLFPDQTSAGTPYFVASLSIPYNNAPDSTILSGYTNFQAFETVTMQVTTWALMQALSLQNPQSPVTLDAMTQIDQHPDELVDWIDYPTLLEQLSVFAMAASVATAPAGTTLYAASFPMPGFLTLVTKGRQSGGAAADFNYRFDANNLVSQTYLDQVAADFDQLYVNQTAGTQTGNLAEPAATTTPLVQAMFLEYFKGLIRGAVHELVQTLQGPPATKSMALDSLFIATVAAGGFASLSGLMSSMFRSGLRLPYTAGLTVPGATPANDYNPFYALMWQEFPVGSLSGSGSSAQYTVALNADPGTKWFASTVNWALTQTLLAPYQGVTASQVQIPSAPVQLPFTNTGPQYFTFENPTVWAGPAGTGGSLRPFPAALAQLQAAQGTSPVNVVVESRAGAAPGTSGTPLLTSQFTWATQINLTIKTIPTGAPGSKKYLPDVFALTGASAQDELLLQQIVELLGGSSPAYTSPGIAVLYQANSGTPGLTSDTIDASDVFALRTNTTTVSAPPAPMFAAEMLATAAPQGVPVGATIGGSVPLGQSEFLHIIQQAVVTNASGYYLRYANTSGDSFPESALATGFAPITLLIPWNPDGTGNTTASPAQIQPFYNAIVLSSSLDTSLVYYAGTTDAALSIQYPAVAPGAVGFELIGNNTATVSVPADSAAARLLDSSRGYTYDEIITAHVGAGIYGDTELSEQLAPLAEAAGPAQLNALYALLTYQIEATSGFNASPLSAPVQPQNPGTSTTAPTRVSSEVTAAEQTYQVFAPLYNFAQGQTTRPNRYASIGSPFTVDFFVNDAFGNQMPAQSQLTATGTNLYFDPIVPIDQWTGIVTSYDFGVPADANNPPKAGVFNLLLAPSETAFAGWKPAQFANALPGYETIQTQVGGPGVSFYAETNFALDGNGNMARIALDAAPIIAMVDGMVAYISDRAMETLPVNPAPFPDPVPFALTIPTGGAALPPVFELSVLAGVERDANLIAPSLKDHSGAILYPAAQNVASSVPARFGGTGQPNITTFAAAFGIALATLTLSVGLNGAQPAQTKSSTARARKKLTAMGVPSDGGSGGSAPQSLFAVASVLLGVSIGTAANSGPFYSSPTPLDNALNTAPVDMPVLPAFTPPVPPLPASKLFTDVDLDQLNRQFFSAVDAYLAPASAAKAFELAQIDGNPDAYTPVAAGREQLADKYTKFEIDRMFADSPYSPTDTQLDEAKDAFGQQMRAALASAYALDTVLQYLVTWNGDVPASVGDRIELFGQIGPTPADTTSPEMLAKISLSTAHVPVVSGGDGLLTFLFGTSDVESIQTMTMDLQYNVTHVQYFLESQAEAGTDEARPSIWLQLVVPPAPPHVGPVVGGKPVPVTIPVVFRQYPSPPTFVNQTALAATTGQCPNPNPLVEAAAWDYAYSYQAQVTVHDQLLTFITYNTNLSTSSNGSSSKLAALDGPTRYTLFQALARFSAAYAVLGPVLVKLTDPNWQLAAQAFAPLVTDVVNNTDWDESGTTAMLAAMPLQYTVDDYVVTDVQQQDSQQQLITMTWPAAQGESSWTGASLTIAGVAPNGTPYPNQTTGTTTDGITDTYTPTAPIVNEWVGHQVAVNCLNVLSAENAMAALQIERNAIVLPNPSGSAQPNSTIQGEFVYMTPIVRPSQPATPFVDNDTPIDVSQLPNGSNLAPLSNQIFTMLNDLLRYDAQLSALLSATKTSDGTDPVVQRKVKVACGFQYPVLSIAGVNVDPKSDPIMPIVPVVLARSFVVDVTTPNDIEAFSAAFATAITTWSGQNGVTFGSAGQPSAGRFVFDVTLYAELSGANTPVLRLRQLFLMLSNLDPASTPSITAAT